MDLHNRAANPSSSDPALSNDGAFLNLINSNSSNQSTSTGQISSQSDQVIEASLPQRSPLLMGEAETNSSAEATASLNTMPELGFEMNQKSKPDICSPNAIDSILETQNPVGRCAPLKNVKRNVGHFALEHELGHGASGTVFRARDERLERSVAIKVIHQSALDDTNTSESSFAEARSLARLPHPNIVQIYEVGETQYSPYLVTELVEGPSLRELAHQEPGVSFRTAAELMKEVAEALDFAHRNGVLHRDLKPSNILLAPCSQPQKSSKASQRWRAKISDFGLAKQLDAQQIGPTRQIIGTPAYMSPEAADGAMEGQDRRSDLFSLGVILYELLTKQLPFTGSVGETLAKVRQCEFARPRNIEAKIPADLEAICLKCLQKSPRDRYDSAAELAADLNDWLRGKPISARHTSPLERATKWCRRQPYLASALIASALLFIVAASLTQTLFSQQSAHTQKEFDRQIDQFLVAQTDLQEHIRAIRESPECIKIVHDRLQQPNLSASAKCQLLLVEGPKSNEEIEFLWGRLIEGSPPGEFTFIVDWLAPHASELNPSLDGETDDHRALKISLAVLKWPIPESNKKAAIKTLAELISSPNFHERWVSLLVPHRDEIVSALAEEYQPENNIQPYCESGAALLCQLCQDDSKLLCSVLQIVGDDDVDTVCQAFRLNRTQAIEQLRRQAKSYTTSQESSLVLTRLARAIIALTQLSISAEEWDLYFDVEDPRIEAYFVLSAVRQGLDANRIAKLLAQNPRPLALRAIILSMDGLRQRQFKSQSNLLAWLKDQYISNSDAGVHSAIRYCLERFGQREWAHSTDMLKLRNDHRPDFNWYVDSLGQTMVILPSKLTCIDDGSDEPVTVAMASTEITNRQLRSMNFSTYNPATGKSPEDDVPAQKVSARYALQYCIALDELEDIDDLESAVIKQQETLVSTQNVPMRSARAAHESTRFEIDRFKSGYRLPTSSELEIASEFEQFADAWRSDKNTAWLSCYYHPRPNHPITPSFSRMPNRLGLFHAMGNAWEWTIESEHCKSSMLRMFSIESQDRLFIFGGPVSQQSNLLFGKTPKPLVGLEQSQAGFRLVRTLNDVDLSR